MTMFWHNCTAESGIGCYGQRHRWTPVGLTRVGSTLVGLTLCGFILGCTDRKSPPANVPAPQPPVATSAPTAEVPGVPDGGRDSAAMASEGSGANVATSMSETDREAPHATTTAVSDDGPASPSDHAAEVAMRDQRDEGSGLPGNRGEHRPSSAGTMSDETATVQDAVAETRRILYLAPHRPIIIDLAFYIDGVPHARAAEQAIRDLIEPVGERSGTIRWLDLIQHPRFRHGQFGNAPIQGDTELQTFVQRFDINRNGTVDLDELPAYLANDSQARSELLRADIELADPSRERESAWFSWLDVNRDGALDEDEMAQAGQRILRRDANGDGLVQVSDLAVNQTGSSGRGRGRHALVLSQTPNWSNLLSRFDECYAFDNPVQSADFADAEELFAAVDQNGDDSWSPTEVEWFGTCAPDLRVDVRFGDDDAPLLAVSPVSDGDTSTHNTQVVGVSPGNQIADVHGTVVQLLARRQATGLWESPNWDAIWQTWDGNQDGHMDAQEYGNFRNAFGDMPFEAADVAGDGMLSEDDTIAALRRRTTGQRLQVSVRLASLPDALWSHLDINHDDRLDPIECSDLAHRLRELAVSQQPLTLDQLPPAILLEVGLGPRQENRPMPVPDAMARYADAEPAVRGPAWWRAMDRNLDGYVTRDEFLGDRAVFGRFDQDDDGLMSEAEASAVAAE